VGRDEVLKTLRARRAELAKRFGVRDLALFGSFARGEERPESDIDILVEFDGPPTFDGYLELRDFLGALLGPRVDVVTVGALRPRVRERVMKELLRVA